MPNPNIVAFMVSKITAFIQTDEHGWILVKHRYTLKSKTLPSICYILSNESGIAR